MIENMCDLRLWYTRIGVVGRIEGMHQWARQIEVWRGTDLQACISVYKLSDYLERFLL